MATKRTSAPSGVLVLHKTLDILDTIKKSPNGVGLTDLAHSLSLPKATVYRIATTLVSREYLEQTASGTYRVSRKMFVLPISEQLDQMLIRVAQPFILELAAMCNETVNLGLIDAAEIVVIHTAESSQAVRMSSKVGNRRFLHATALGKVMLAAMDRKDIDHLIGLKGMPQITENTITNFDKLMDELQRIRRLGYAIDNQENEIEGRCIASPITAHGQVVAALSISGPEFRMSLKRARALAPELKKTCATISDGLSKDLGAH
jgi:IclR family transcriptional regulator, KDG regulon repressor